MTLEWSPIKLANAKLRSLDLYRNGERLSAVPSPMTNTSTKHSGMDINTEYSFQLILRTTAGTFPSNVLRVRTHTMSDTSGICVCFGNVQDPVLLENAKLALREMGAKWSDAIQIDTSHFVCTTPAATPSGASASGSVSTAPGVAYQRALQLSIPVVQPHWILACHAERRMVPIASFYLGAASAAPPTSAGFNRPQSMSQAPGTPASPPPNNQASKVRASMPPPARGSGTPPNNSSSPFVNQRQAPRGVEAAVPEHDEDMDIVQGQMERATVSSATSAIKAEHRKSRNGSMNREFKFPPTSPGSPLGDAPQKSVSPQTPVVHVSEHLTEEEVRHPGVITPSSIEVPPPPPMDKEKSLSKASLDDSVDDDVGDTVDIPLN